MSIQAKLHIEGEAPINVLECNFAFKRPTDEVGVPLGPSLLKGVNLLLEATKGHLFWEWATLPMECKQAELHFVPHILGGSSRILLLIDVYCVGYQVYFNNNTPIPITEKVALTCGGFRDTSSVEEYSTHWRQTFPFPEGVEETVLHREEEKPRLIRWYLTDKNNTTIKKGKIGEQVIVHLKTEYLIGKPITLNLKDKTVDYKYQGNILKNDTLKDYIIQSNYDKIVLDVIQQQN